MKLQYTMVVNPWYSVQHLYCKLTNLHVLCYVFIWRLCENCKPWNWECFLLQSRKKWKWRRRYSYLLHWHYQLWGLGHEPPWSLCIYTILPISISGLHTSPVGSGRLVVNTSMPHIFPWFCEQARRAPPGSKPGDATDFLVHTNADNKLVLRSAVARNRTQK